MCIPVLSINGQGKQRLELPSGQRYKKRIQQRHNLYELATILPPDNHAHRNGTGDSRSENEASS